MTECFGGSKISDMIWNFCTYIFYSPAISEMRNSAGGSPVNLQIYIVIMRKKHRLLHLVVGCLFIIIMLLFRTYYRPWIYTNHLFDFYLADTYTNLFGECVVFFILVSLFSPNEMYKPIKLLLYSSCGLIIYELLGLIVEGGLCDYKDIIATFVGALLSYVINRIIIQY